MRTRRIGTLLLAVVASIGIALATSVRPVNLLEMLGVADRVFVGTVLEIRHRPGPGQLPVRVTTFRVTELVKGQVVAKVDTRPPQGGVKVPVVTLAQVWTGSHRQDGVRPLPAPGFTPGEEVLLFLHADSELGLSSPVGFGLGKLSVERHGNRRFVRFSPEQRAVLLRGLEHDLPEALVGAGGASGVVPLEDLVVWLKRQRAR